MVPRDALSPIAGAATWDFGDGFASGNKVTHIFSTPGTYTITVKASDTLGNTTIVANRSIHIVAVAGGTKAAVLRLNPLKTLQLKTFKKQKYVAVSVYLDFATNVEFRVQRGAKLVSKKTKKMPAGTSALHLPIAKSQLRKGTYKVTVRALTGTLKASRSFRVR